jgi:hypothetical protein
VSWFIAFWVAMFVGWPITSSLLHKAGIGKPSVGSGGAVEGFVEFVLALALSLGLVFGGLALFWKLW